MSSLFGMNAVELTGEDPSPGAGDDSRPVPDEIVSFWPITFKRQILIMCTLFSLPEPRDSTHKKKHSKAADHTHGF